jgi:hypothetical protein
VIDNYLNQAITLGFGNRQPDTTQPKVQCISAKTVALGGNTTVTLPGPIAGLKDGALVRVRGFKTLNLMNGLWRITNSNNVGPLSSFDLQGSQNYSTFQVGKATFQIVQQAFDPGNSFGFANVATRKTGRPFGLQRGKASTRVLHH